MAEQSEEEKEEVKQQEPEVLAAPKQLGKEDVKRKNCDCKPSVLCVDDMSFNLMPLVASIKRFFKIDCVSAINGKQAVDMYTERLNKACQCKDRTFKLIIMDVQMPVMGGEEAAQKILDL